MNSECLRISDQLRRAFRGDAWHGPSLLDLLAEVTPKQAQARPLRSVHSIWELVLHIHVYLLVAFDATRGLPMPKLYGTEGDWPARRNDDSVSWFDIQDSLFRDAEKLAQAIESLADEKLKNPVPGRPYDFYYLFHGIVQHSLYHAGQIAILKKAISAP
jgi:uncharacterized damage-inducible protein DinB